MSMAHSLIQVIASYDTIYVKPPSTLCKNVWNQVFQDSSQYQ